MGAAASTKYEPELLMEVVAQQQKPLDVSDIENLESAKHEIQMLRRMINYIDVNKLYKSQDEDNTNIDQNVKTEEPHDQTVDIPRGQVIVDILRQKMEERYHCLREVFTKIDVDKSGYISKEEFQDICTHWGILLSDEDFDNINATYQHQETCSENDHGINYNEFLNMMTHTINYKPGEGEKSEGANLSKFLKGTIMDCYDTMKQAFSAIDKDCSGTVERAELDRIFQSYQIGHTPTDLDLLFSEFDKNGDGVFSYGEFVKIMSSTK